MSHTISPKKVRYIKLGEKGIWEEECLKDGTVRLGFWTGKAVRFRLCRAGKWEALRRVFLNKGNDSVRAGTFTTAIRAFFEDDGTTLWITFHGDHMYWGFLKPTPPQADDGSTWRSVVGGWRCEDLDGKKLTKGRIGQALAKYAKFPGTSCELKKIATQITQVINGTGKVPQHHTADSNKRPTVFPSEIQPHLKYPEGAVCRVTVNAYERSPTARRACLEHHGTTCSICEFDFGRVYGPVMDGFVHVHHLRELSNIGVEYNVDPIADLRPVCPNCHAVLHSRTPAFAIEEVAALIKKYNKNSE
jgi:hypothetical protein